MRMYSKWVHWAHLTINNHSVISQPLNVIGFWTNH